MDLSRRADALTALGDRRFDVLVIGGGIVGAGIAAAASAHGLAVALVDKGDFGAATSSSSSKLIHGGLRYLRLGDVRLVREAHEERRHLMTVVAPHLVHQIPFLLPLYEHGPYRPYVVQTGIALYSTLARARLNGLVDPDRARRMVPELRLEGLRKCGLYVDCWTNDSRLTLANVRATADAGGTVANYAEVVGLRLEQGRVAGAEVSADGGTIAIRARAVVNASGPWLDAVRRLEDPSVGRSIRLSKGVHVLLDPGPSWSAALTIPHDKVRVSFAVPWQGMLLLGTTDALYEGDVAEVTAEEPEVEQVLAEAAVALGPEARRPQPHARDICRAARAAGRQRRHGRRPARDRLHARRRRDAERRRGQADDVPAHRDRCAGGASHRPRAARGRQAPAAAAGRTGARPRSAARGGDAARFAPTCASSTGRWQARCSRRRSTSRPCSSRSRRGPRTSPRRPAMPPAANGRSPSTTWCGGERRSRSAGARGPR